MTSTTLHEDGTRTMILKGTTLVVRNEVQGREAQVFFVDEAVLDTVPAAHAAKIPNAAEMLAVMTRGDVRAIVPAKLREAVERAIAMARENLAEAALRHLTEDVRCDRCGDTVAQTDAVRQTESGRLAGSVVPVTAHYCPACASVLRATGELDARRRD